MTFRRFSFIRSLLLGGAVLCSTSAIAADDTIDVLMLTKSSGFEHDVIKRKDGEFGHTEKIMLDLAKKNGFRIVITKDAGLINKDTLAQFDVVQLYTTAELCERGGDNNPPMSLAGRQEFLDWINNGGGVVGTHTATDTFHNWEENGKKPYIEMIGGEFAYHGAQQEGQMKVVKHPITAHLTDDIWTLMDEYYLFVNVTPSNPLLILDSKQMKEDRYKASEPYANTWYKEYGKGRVFHTALGHREDVWTNPKYQELVVRGIKWAAKRLEE